MTPTEPTTFLRLRWPDDQVPAGSPVWLHYEVDRVADAVLRTVEIYADGRVARNSIEIEQRRGAVCPSLIATSLQEAFDGLQVEPMSRETFDALWAQGIDTPFWNGS